MAQSFKESLVEPWQIYGDDIKELGRIVLELFRGRQKEEAIVPARPLTLIESTEDTREIVGALAESHD